MYYYVIFQFIDELTADYGGDFVQQLVRIFFQDDVTVRMERNSLAKAISGRPFYLIIAIIFLKMMLR